MTTWRCATAMALTLVAGSAVGADEVYRNDFERPDRLRGYWSETRREATPTQGRRFLGRFGNETVTLALKGLPKHRYVRLSFDLYLMHNWRGGLSGPPKSAWQLAVENGPLLVDATFSVWPDFPKEGQSYPANEPLCESLGGTGAAEINKLGYMFDARNGVRDSVYRMNFTVPHRADAIAFHFAALGLVTETTKPTGWGLDNVVVETLGSRQGSKPSAEDLAAAWEDLTAADALKAHRAVWKLIAGEEQTVAFLAERLVEPLQPERLQQQLKRLHSDNFKEREDATQRLTVVSPWARPLLREVRDATEPLEVRNRIDRVLKAAGPGGTSFRRSHHVRYVLELIGSESASRLLGRLRES
jgi:hypothetical protein